MEHQLEAELLRVAVNYRVGAWDQAAAEGERLVVLIEDLDQGWLRARAHLMAVYVAAGRGQWRCAADHLEAAAAGLTGRSGAGSLELANATTAIAVASDDPNAIIAVVGALGDLGRLAGLEPTRLMFWPAYAHALARLGRADEADRALRPFEEFAQARGRRSAMAERDGLAVTWKPSGSGPTPRVRHLPPASRRYAGWPSPTRRPRRGWNTAGSSAIPASAGRPTGNSARRDPCSPVSAHGPSVTAATPSSATTRTRGPWRPRCR